MQSADLERQLESFSKMSDEQLIGELVDDHYASLELLGPGFGRSKIKAFNEYVVPKLVKALCPARKVLMAHATDLTVAVAIHLAATNPPHVAAAAAIFIARIGLDKFCQEARARDLGSDDEHGASKPEPPPVVVP